MQPIHVFFFRGLSTYGHDNAKWSFFDFGPVYKGFDRAFTERGFIFHPVTGMGTGTLAEVTARALEFFRADPVWNSEARVVFVGHSAGGLVARLTLDALISNPATPAGKVAGLLTIASPNRGSQMAKLCLDMPSSHRLSAMFLKSCGYDITGKKHFFQELTSENVGKVFAKAVTLNGVRPASIVCSCPRREWCWPLRLFYLVKAFGDFRAESDGVVEKETQSYGQVLAELPIDHFRQVGLFRKGRLFDEMCDIAASFIKEAHAAAVSR